MSLADIKKIAESAGFVCLENEPMKAHTTFKIGGPAELFIECSDIDRLGELLPAVKDSGTKLTVIGNGSNLLVSDSGIKGVVLCICDSKVSVSGNTVTAASGTKLSKVCTTACDASLKGLEFAWGIPGSVGGAVYMNAGAYGGEMSQVVSACTSVTRNGEIVKRTASELDFGYRTSVFKNTDEIILSAEFKLSFGEKAEIRSLMEDYIGRRKSKQPLEYPSAGSTFKRPVGNFAGALIEQCGLKGCSFGGAEVSEKHAGFIINKGGATCEDVRRLVEHIKTTVQKNTGVTLETEIIYLG